MIACLEAHKLILALHSDHFKNSFFGSGALFKEKEDGFVVIKETTKEAFDDFVGFNYEKRIEFEKKSLAELYEILNLAERYQVRELKEKVVVHIKKFPISMDNVIKVAATASEFYQFTEESEALYENCVIFIEAQFATLRSFLTFVRSSLDESTVVALLKDINLEDEKCANCQQKPCRNRSETLVSDLLVTDMKLKTIGGYQFWGENYMGRLCKVVNSSGGKVTVKWLSPPHVDPPKVNATVSIISSGGTSKFEYACDK